MYALLRLKRQSQKRRELTVVLEVGRVDTGTGGLEDTVTNRWWQCDFMAMISIQQLRL